MSSNRGKDFEGVIKDCILQVPDVDVQRLYDSTNGFVGVRQPSDYIVYKFPYQYYVECKSTNSHTLHKDYLTQLDDLAKKRHVKGVVAGFIIWYIKDDVTVFIPVETAMQHFYNRCMKSISVKDILNGSMKESGYYLVLEGRKKRVFFDYDFKYFFKEIEAWQKQRL